MNKVRILLSGKANLNYYEAAVNGAGAEATALYLPPVDTGYDGLILCGGSDIDPAYYQEPVNGSVNIDSARDKVEWALLQAYLEAGKPILGICRGLQMLNVYFGGTLHQDIPEAQIHTNRTEHYLTHKVTALEDSIVGRLYGREFSVNSSHHQAIRQLGKDLRPTAFWQDTYIEAIEHTGAPVFALQWHPERMCFGEKRADAVDGTGIFETFIAMCRK